MAHYIPTLFWTMALTVALSMTSCSLFSQPIQYERTPAPKRELRAVWVATVLNIDYPQAPSTNPVALREQYRNLLDQMSDLGMNAVIVQVRPAGDAFYPTALAPWSQYLTGRQGQAPADNFDPLEMMIEEAHARAIEFHAWINPFRVSMNLDTASFSLAHILFKHPDWVVTYGNKMYLDPGIPAVREHLVQVVEEIASDYNIDGIHIDDYFYPYPEHGVPFPDSISYAYYGQSHADIEDWRRNNTDELVRRLSERIREIRPTALFGVSPFGVWRNISDDPENGSDTRAGATSYDDLYADVLNWMNRGWIDYVMPQLYWNIGFEPADHLKLLQWWSQRSRNVQLYTGHAAYKVANNQVEAWNQPSEIPRQVDLNRRNFQSQGSAFFSARSLLANPLQLKDTLRSLYSTHALWPERPDLEIATPRPPELQRLRWRRNGVDLRWKAHQTDRELNMLPHYYAIYRFPGNRVGDLNDPQYLLHVTPIQQGCTSYRFFDFDTEEEQTYTYVVTALNRAHTESRPSNPRIVFRKTNGVKRMRAGSQSRPTASRR